MSCLESGHLYQITDYSFKMNSLVGSGIQSTIQITRVGDVKVTISVLAGVRSVRKNHCKNGCGVSRFALLFVELGSWRLEVYGKGAFSLG